MEELPYQYGKRDSTFKWR